jgi:predicted 2-oxoglutarate/Fe(II)-dependent dioxygenase YbiX
VLDIDGNTRRMIDYGHTRRGDREIDEEPLRRACRSRIARRLLPLVERCYGLRITRMERYLVSCYEPGGHFAPHRDNTTRGTAHRQLAVSLFLNTGQYEGGHLRFPEYGNALYGAPAGGAVVFSCSLLHAATPVRAGRRMMFLPFLYDDASAQVRAENERHLDVATAQRAGNAGINRSRAGRARPPNGVLCAFRDTASHATICRSSTPRRGAITTDERITKRGRPCTSSSIAGAAWRATPGATARS